MERSSQKELLIVLVDDNTRNQDQFAIALNYVGLRYQCRFIKTIDLAMKKLRHIAPDFVIINTNALNDSKCFQRIKKIKNLKAVKVVSYGSNKQSKNSQEILKNDADYYISETTDTYQLIEKLKSLFSKMSLHSIWLN